MWVTWAFPTVTPFVGCGGTIGGLGWRGWRRLKGGTSVRTGPGLTTVDGYLDLDFMSGYQSGSASARTEIKRAIFTVDLTAHGAPLQADPDDVQNVFDHLRHNYNLTWFSSLRRRKVIRAPHTLPYISSSTLPIPASLICANLKDLHFDVHDVEILDSGKPQALKPSSWGFFIHAHPMGPKLSGKTLSLNNEDGLRSVIEHMVGILSLRDEAGFGLDRHVATTCITLNGPLLCYSFAGRANSCVQTKMCGIIICTNHRVFQIFPEWQSRELTLVDRVPRLPEEMVYKLSYQTDGALRKAPYSLVSLANSESSTSLDTIQSGRDTDTSWARGNNPSSMIGHYNLFLGGVLHRDVSSGNILRLREPINRTPGLSTGLLGLHDQDVKLCRGFLVDGDHAIEWCTDAITPSLERSKFAKITNTNSRIHDLWRSLSSRNFFEIFVREDSAEEWTDKVFRDLIRDWLRISKRSRTDVDELQETLIELVNDGDTSDAQKKIFGELNEHSGKVYKEFIQSGYRHLQTIRTFSNWEDVVSFNGELLLNK
ncbi:hypothetical protein EDB84DRAFT_1435570 [Lactarius hengduanensis]|nr:hypothetical protein EDB84DRAFT_1435570 [Lactarius hengduanensis]